MYFFQAGAPFCIENAKCWPVLAHVGNFSKIYELFGALFTNNGYQVSGRRQILVRGPDESKLALLYLFLRAIDIAFRLCMISGGYRGNFFANLISIFLNCVIKVRRCPNIPLANFYGEIFEEKMFFIN